MKLLAGPTSKESRSSSDVIFLTLALIFFYKQRKLTILPLKIINFWSKERKQASNFLLFS